MYTRPKHSKISNYFSKEKLTRDLSSCENLFFKATEGRKPHFWKGTRFIIVIGKKEESSVTGFQNEG